MKATPHRRFERMRRIEALLPPVGAALSDCRDAKWLLEQLDEEAAGEDGYYGRADAGARLRALQRDLQDLVKEGRIEAANPKGKPLRYRRFQETLLDDASIWADTLRQIRDLVGGVLRARQLDRLWARLRTDEGTPLLGDDRLRILSDNLRLQPPAVGQNELTAVITALTKGYMLDVTYENVQRERKQARLHPQAVVQRGPIAYLYALKNDEEVPVRLYALHRFVAAKAVAEVAARKAKGFSLDQAIAEGKTDFGQGRLITLKVLVRGYLTRLLLDCPLSADQDSDNEPEDPAFDIAITATVPSTGQLLRWLLGAGDNLKVLEPEDLRHTVAVQAAKMAGLYQA